MGRIAIEQCLVRSDLDPKEIQLIHAHGTSTKLNDAYEAALINSLFPLSVAVSSTKGATGHTLGASGALGVAFCLMALQQQVIPPCVGLRTSAFDLNLITTAKPQQLRSALCFSFGFGGQNAVVGIQRH
jgi:3-oxoacyl-[acyl-carrier-protein] synthase II